MGQTLCIVCDNTPWFPIYCQVCKSTYCSEWCQKHDSMHASICHARPQIRLQKIMTIINRARYVNFISANSFDADKKTYYLPFVGQYSGPDFKTICIGCNALKYTFTMQKIKLESDGHKPSIQVYLCSKCHVNEGFCVCYHLLSHCTKKFATDLDTYMIVRYLLALNFPSEICHLIMSFIISAGVAIHFPLAQRKLPSGCSMGGRIFTLPSIRT
jgi:hypothetical protein